MLPIYMAMKPNPQYPFADSTMLLRAMIINKEGRAAAGAEVTAWVTSDDSARAVLAQDEAHEGADRLVLRAASGRLSIGTALMVKQGTHDELIEISGICDDQRTYKLKAPLMYGYERGALCLPAYRTYSNQKGEIAIPFQHLRGKSVEVKLTASLYQQRFELVRFFETVGCKSLGKLELV
jgi:hypothetical protein